MEAMEAVREVVAMVAAMVAAVMKARAEKRRASPRRRLEQQCRSRRHVNLVHSRRRLRQNNDAR